MPPDKHICLVCGKDTTDRSEICQFCQCDPDEPPNPQWWDIDDRDAYERDIDDLLNLERLIDYEEYED